MKRTKYYIDLNGMVFSSEFVHICIMKDNGLFRGISTIKSFGSFYDDTPEYEEALNKAKRYCNILNNIFAK